MRKKVKEFWKSVVKKINIVVLDKEVLILSKGLIGVFGILAVMAAFTHSIYGVVVFLILTASCIYNSTRKVKDV